MKAITKKYNNNLYKKHAEMFKSLAHPTRLFIVDVLSKGEDICVCELTDLVGVDISTISRHLLVLKNAGIITDEKRSNWVYYRLKCKCVLDFIECFDRVISNSK